MAKDECHDDIYKYYLFDGHFLDYGLNCIHVVLAGFNPINLGQPERPVRIVRTGLDPVRN